jgi:pyrroloquinoline quinone (PQQ) biosynthesis protein C
MNSYERLKTEWFKSLEKQNENAWSQRLSKGDLQLKHYKSYLRETYFNAGRNPHIQVMAAARFTNEQRNITRKIFQHATSEVSHDLLALNDLKALGHDVSNIPNELPLPDTIALVSFPIYVINYLNPIGYLGYLFHLEFLPTLNGPKYLEILQGMGIPKEGLTFIEEHAQVDQYHVKLIESYMEELVQTKEDLDFVIYCAQTTCHLHGQMISGAFAAVDGRDDL